MIQGAISGVYNYCDRWCERCRFQQRCHVFHDVKAMETGIYEPPEVPAPPGWGDHLDFNLELTPKERLQADQDYQLRERLTTAHPISQQAAAYLRSVSTGRSADFEHASATDPILALAWDTVHRMSFLISVKSRRAVHELVDDDEDAVDRTLDPRGIQSDGNGTAKLVRLLVRESIEAWGVIHNCASEACSGAGDKISALEALDAALDRAFPFALEFIRPGFDE